MFLHLDFYTVFDFLGLGCGVAFSLLFFFDNI